MKKIGIILILIIVFVVTLINTNIDNEIIMNEQTNIDSTDSISMMLETKAASGIYEATDNTSWPSNGYKFNSTLSKCANGSTLSWDSDSNTVTYSGTVADKCYIYFDLIPTITDVCDTGDNLSECIQELYTTAGEVTVGLYYFDGLGDYENYDQEYVDYRYIYSGGTDDVYNFLCLGSDCTDSDNLYRILGIYLNDNNEYEVKVMKYNYSDSALAIDSVIGWEYTSLYTYLNDTYLSSMNEYDDLIETHTWNIPTYYGGDYTALTHAGYVNSATQTVDAKIALIYDSDFGYSTDSSYWTTTLGGYYTTSHYSWMVGDYFEWTLSYFIISKMIRSSELTSYGNIYIGYAFQDYTIQGEYYARPSFYLSTDVAYSSGTGTKSDPIILVIE